MTATMEPGVNAAPVDDEMMDAHRLGDGELDTIAELPVPQVPVLPELRLEPPEVRPPRFEELWRELHSTLTGHGESEPKRRGQVVTVFSPKGGAGTTTVATNMAVLLAGRGRHRVCLVDLDLEFGDVSIMTGLSPARSLVDAVGRTFDESTVDAVLTPWRDGIDCVLAPVDPSAGERIDSPLVTALLAALRRRYDYVVVDTPSHLTEHALDAFDAGDHHLVITTPQLTALKSTRLLLDTLQLLGYPDSRRCVLLNQAGPRTLSRDAVQEAISHPVTAVVPASTDVAGAADAGVPLAVRRSDHPIVKALDAQVARAITGEPLVRRRAWIGRHRKKAS
jgi:pilus assembly protein CpaE